jgi:hypothetical protein
VHAATAATSSTGTNEGNSSDSADGATAGSTAIVVASEQQRDDASVMYVSVCAVILTGYMICTICIRC